MEYQKEIYQNKLITIRKRIAIVDKSVVQYAEKEQNKPL